MSTQSLSSVDPRARRAGPWLRGLWDELHAREPRLARYGALLLALMLPMALAWGLDDRMLRGVDIWIKPMKFALSIAVLAWTTAWFVGHLKASARRRRAVDWIVWLLIGAGSFELAYIVQQAGLGQASHYNESDLLHGVMYALMGVGAIVLTATQPMLAWQLHRHGDTTRPAGLRLAVQLGLVLTFVLGAGAGIPLSSIQPPDAGAGSLPLLGWSLAGGDLRPAHFVGIHAEQALPLLALAITRWRLPRPRAWVVAVTLGWLALFALLMAWGLGLTG